MSRDGTFRSLVRARQADRFRAPARSGGLRMAKIVFAAFVLFILHGAVAQIGTAEAALWLTAGTGFLMLLCAGLARI